MEKFIIYEIVKEQIYGLELFYCFIIIIIISKRISVFSFQSASIC